MDFLFCPAQARLAPVHTRAQQHGVSGVVEISSTEDSLSATASTVSTSPPWQEWRSSVTWSTAAGQRYVNDNGRLILFSLKQKLFYLDDLFLFKIVKSNRFFKMKAFDNYDVYLFIILLFIYHWYLFL